MYLRSLTTISVVFMALALLIPTSTYAYSSAPLNFCNNSAVKVGVAVGYHSPGVNDPADHSVLTGPFVSTGWSAVQPGECRTFANPFDARYMFWYAWGPQINADDPTVLAMRNAASPNSFCVTNYFKHDDSGRKVPEFTFEDENKSMNACDEASGSSLPLEGNTLWIVPRYVDTWVNATVNFSGD